MYSNILPEIIRFPGSGTKLATSGSGLRQTGAATRSRRSIRQGEQVMDFGRISRRHLLQGGPALTLGAAAGGRPAFAADTTIGFIYVGSRDDYGYNQAHAQGAAALKKLPGRKVGEEEKVPETDAVENTMESMINLDGATLLFPTSFGYYNPHMIKEAGKNKAVTFLHCGGLY